MRYLDKIPLRLMIKTLFSSKLISTGLFILLVPTILLSGFLPNIDFYNAHYKINSKSEAKAILLSKKETNNSLNGKTAIKYNYEFYLDDEIINGYSYGYGKNYKKGDSVVVEYLINDSSISRIKSTKNGSFGISVLGFILIFVLFGAVVLIIPIYNRIEFLGVLKTGFEIVPSNLETELKILTIPFRKSSLYNRLTFEYKISNNTFGKVIYTSQGEFELRRIRRSNIIVNSRNHSKSFVLETMPIKMKNYIVDNSIIADYDS